MSKTKALPTHDEDQAIAVAHALRSSPRKLNLVAASIRGQHVAHALNLLAFNRRRIAQTVRKVLQSAIANAENNHGLDVDRLVVSEASVGRAFALKRFHARGRGRGASIEKPYSHLRIIVTAEDDENGLGRKASGRRAARADAGAPKAKKAEHKKTADASSDQQQQAGA
ncbi:MAG: 50S ribosomal protein L22 [Alphaproteobacteria bacterium]|nr:MAG: 50S ribosomal protein L22 [Alphaproteobacteria bacterium]